MTVVGAICSDRAGIPKEMKERKSCESPSTLYVCNKSVLVSYVIKTKTGVKNILVLSSMHRNALTTGDEREKPHVITFYNRTKGGVDVMGMMAGIHTTQFKCRRWTMNALAYVLDTVRTNMFTLWNEIHSDNKMGSFDFVGKLAEDLIKPHIQYSYQNVTGLQQSVVAMKNVLEVEEDHQYVAKEGSDCKRCFYCIESIVRKPDYKAKKQKLAKCKWVCQKCSRSLCKDHLNSVCNRRFQAM